MEGNDQQGTDDASIKPVSSLRSHFEALRPATKPQDERPPSRLALEIAESGSASPLVRASFDLPRPSSPWERGGNHGGPLTPRPEKGRSVSPPKSSHRRPMSMFMGSSPQLAPSVNVESPHSPPRSYFARQSSRSPERGDNTPFGKVRELISQHSSREPSRPSTPAVDRYNVSGTASVAAKPPPVNRSDKPKIPASIPRTVEGPRGPVATVSPVNPGGLQPENRRPSFDARISPFNTPPSSDESTSPPEDPSHPEKLAKSLASVSLASGTMAKPSPSDYQAGSRNIDARSVGFQRAPTAPLKRDPRALGFDAAEPSPPARESMAQPSRANTVSERPSARDPRTLGFSTQMSQTQRHVSETISLTKSAYQPKISSHTDARALGFGGSAVVSRPLAEDASPALPVRHTMKAPLPQRTNEPDAAPIRNVRQPSPVPDRGLKPLIHSQPSSMPAQTVSKIPPSASDTRFPPPPKRYTGDLEPQGSLHDRLSSTRAERAGYGTDSDDAEGPPEPVSRIKTEYPDATQTNRRAPYHEAGLHGLHLKGDSRAFDVCGKYLCVTGVMTRVYDMLSGEQITGIHHGETVRATAVAFKPAADLASEGKRIWIGNTFGDLQEIDILTHSVVAENSAHNRREIVKILRHGRSLWTLDDDGKLFVWKSDEMGTPNLKYSHLSHKVQKGHTFSLAAQGKLWLATGKEIRIYRPGNESDFLATSQVLVQPGSGDITSGCFSEADGGKTYFGHTDGRITIYSGRDYSCIGSVKASDYKINGLATTGDSLWAAYKTGKLYVYDVTQSPWKVRKDWRAHDGPIVGLNLDPSSIWTMQRLQITSIGHDGQAKFWDGMLEQDWIEQAMQGCDVQYCTFREMHAAVVTWNCGAATPYNLRTDFIADAIHSEDPPELLIFGFQEVVDLEDRTVTAKSLLGFGKKKDADTEQHQSRVYREWRDYLSKLISRYAGARYSYSELHTSSLVGLFQCVFVRDTERMNVRDVHAVSVKCGMKGHYGNKGALVTRFVLDDSSLCFINCHLAAGQTQSSHRNNDVATILELESLPIAQDADARMSLFVGGGDGTQILDHEICILNGDLNYRIDTVPRDTVIRMIKANDLAKLLERDQIMVSRRRVSGFRLSSFVEVPITFAPTYKYDVGTDNYDSSEKKRAPAWCDRILYRGPGRVKQLEYRRHEVRVSDHRPVSGLFRLRVKTIDSKKRAKAKKECEYRYDEMAKGLMEQMARSYLIREYGMSEKEAARKLGG